MEEKPRKVEDIVLYHGSLTELNSRNHQRQYEFAPELTFRSIPCSVGDVDIYRPKKERDVPLPLEGIKRELLEKGYSGLVNMRTIMFNKYHYFAVEGTPIIEKVAPLPVNSK